MQFLLITLSSLSVLTLLAVVWTAVTRKRIITQAAKDMRTEFEAVLRQENTSSRQELFQYIQAGIQQSGETTRETLLAQTAVINALRESLDRQITEFRHSLTDSTRQETQTLSASVKNAFELQNQQLEGFRTQLGALTRSNEEKLEGLRSTVENKLTGLQQDNNAKLEAMRATVEEKLQTTLERRLGESFKIVSDNLDKVQSAMLNMQTLAQGVGDLKKVMSNVTTRGAWGEVQLAAILEQFLSPQQYDKNVATKGERERVEFAVKLPGRNGDGTSVWLPIDAKFPKEDYERLVDALNAGATIEAEAAARQLETAIKTNARTICDKYLNPPKTTDFAIMFLPTEGLYAEVLRRRELAECIQRDYRVVIAGPTTLVAILNSLQMGFRTVAIEQRSSEVWQTLAAVKTEFSKFGAALESVKKKLHTASTEIEQVGTRSRVLEKKLRNVECLPDNAVPALPDAEGESPTATAED